MAYYQTPDSVLANYRYDPASPSGLAWARDYTKGKAGDPVGTRNSLGYWVVKSEGRAWLVHRIIYELVKGPIPEGQTVDHKEGLSNLADNLRLADRCQQNHNQGPKKNSKTGIKGVMPFQNGYRGVVRFRGECHRRLFPTLEQASQYVEETRNRLHGEYARSQPHV